MNNEPMSPTVGQPAAPSVQPAENPGQVLGIVSIVLAIMALWLFGIPLAIVSIVKSSKAHASKTLGVVGLILNILAALATVLIFLAVFIAIPALQRQQELNYAASTAASSSETITLSSDYKPVSNDVFFAVPASYAGWTTTTIDEDGVNLYTKNDQSATFMTYQGISSEVMVNDEKATAAAMSAYLTQLNATEVTGTQSTVLLKVLSDGKWLQFETKQMSEKSGEDTIKGVVAVRMYQGHELSLIYRATEDSFSLAEWNNLVSKVQINDGVL
ncbi:MAG: hypothetical protein ABIP74_04785 [Candidatus Saccharimonas sp.]